jgi:hypothetical protein
VTHPLRPYLRDLHGADRLPYEAYIAHGEPHPLGPDWDDMVFLGTYTCRAEAAEVCARYLAAAPGETVPLGYGYEIIRG